MEHRGHCGERAASTRTEGNPPCEHQAREPSLHRHGHAEGLRLRHCGRSSAAPSRWPPEPVRCSATPAYMAPEALGHQLTPWPPTSTRRHGPLRSVVGPIVDDGNAIRVPLPACARGTARVARDGSRPPEVLSATIMRAIRRGPGREACHGGGPGRRRRRGRERYVGAGWVRRGGVNVMATGPIGERISNRLPASDPGALLLREMPPAPVTPRITWKRAPRRPSSNRRWGTRRLTSWSRYTTSCPTTTPRQPSPRRLSPPPRPHRPHPPGAGRGRSPPLQPCPGVEARSARRSCSARW